MKFTLPILAAVPLIFAHTHITNLFVNGVDQVCLPKRANMMSVLGADCRMQGDMTCIRAPSDPGTLTFPVEDLNSPDMACGMYILGAQRHINS